MVSIRLLDRENNPCIDFLTMTFQIQDSATAESSRAKVVDRLKKLTESRNSLGRQWRLCRGARYAYELEVKSDPTLGDTNLRISLNPYNLSHRFMKVSFIPSRATQDEMLGIVKVLRQLIGKAQFKTFYRSAKITRIDIAFDFGIPTGCFYFDAKRFSVSGVVDTFENMAQHEPIKPPDPNPYLDQALEDPQTEQQEQLIEETQAPESDEMEGEAFDEGTEVAGKPNPLSGTLMSFFKSQYLWTTYIGCSRSNSIVIYDKGLKDIKKNKGVRKEDVAGKLARLELRIAPKAVGNQNPTWENRGIIQDKIKHLLNAVVIHEPPDLEKVQEGSERYFFIMACRSAGYAAMIKAQKQYDKVNGTKKAARIEKWLLHQQLEIKPLISKTHALLDDFSDVLKDLEI